MLKRAKLCDGEVLSVGSLVSIDEAVGMLLLKNNCAHGPLYLGDLENEQLIILKPNDSDMINGEYIN